MTAKQLFENLNYISNERIYSLCNDDLDYFDFLYDSYIQEFLLEKRRDYVRHIREARIAQYAFRHSGNDD